MKNIFLRGAAVTALLLLVMVDLGSAQKAGEVDEKEQARADAVADIAPAHRLAEYGMEKKTPEALVIAGGMLLRVHNLTEGKMTPLDVKVMDDKNQAVKGSEKVKLLGTEAEELFDKARAMVATNKGNSAAIEALIKKATADAEARGAIGGPKSVSAMLGSPAFHFFNVGFEPNQPATVNFQATGKCQFEVIGQGGNVLYHQMGTQGSHSWRTAGAKAGLRVVTVKVTNMKGKAVNYTITTN